MEAAISQKTLTSASTVVLGEFRMQCLCTDGAKIQTVPIAHINFRLAPVHGSLGVADSWVGSTSHASRHGRRKVRQLPGWDELPLVFPHSASDQEWHKESLKCLTMEFVTNKHEIVMRFSHKFLTAFASVSTLWSKAAVHQTWLAFSLSSCSDKEWNWNTLGSFMIKTVLCQCNSPRILAPVVESIFAPADSFDLRSFSNCAGLGLLLYPERKCFGVFLLQLPGFPK